MPPKPWAASSLLVEHGDREPGRPGDRAGLVDEPLRGLDVGGHRRQQPRAPPGTRERDRAVEHRLLDATAGDHDPAHRPGRRTGRAEVVVERAQHRALDEGAQSRVVADRRHRGRDGALVLGPTCDRGTGAPQVARRTRTDTDEQQQPEVAVGEAGRRRHRDHRDLACLACRARELEHPEQVEVDLVKQSRGAGPEGDTPLLLPVLLPVLPVRLPVLAPGGREHGQREHVRAGHLRGGEVAQDELGRGDLVGERRDNHGATLYADAVRP